MFIRIKNQAGIILFVNVNKIISFEQNASGNTIVKLDDGSTATCVDNCDEVLKTILSVKSFTK